MMDYETDLSDPSDYLYEDVYDDYETFPDPADYSLHELWKDCLLPTLHDGFNSSARLLCCCCLLKLVMSLTFLPQHVFHITSASLGVYCLYNYFGAESVYIVLFAAIGYLVLFTANNILKSYQGLTCAVFCYLFLIICELFLADKTLWHRIRGCQMLLAMKLISLAFDTDHIEKKLPSPLQCSGYLFHVGSVIFGPWMTYSTYLSSKFNHEISFIWIFTILRSLFLSFSFLTLSTCWSSWIFYSEEWKWIGAYRDALSFRSSHYFVSYLSSTASTMSALQPMTVSAAFQIEFPRSLVEVVVWWNVPMHFWLKTYVFKTAKPLGDFAAILLTYAASSLLHGLNFQLAAVLLSLGFYTYIEHVLRKELSSIFDACICARKCKPNCDHKFKSNHSLVRVANFLFGLLAMYHLAYLGVMFDSSSGLEEQGYNMNHTLQKWRDLDLSSHWVAFLSYIFYYLIR